MKKTLKSSLILILSLVLLCSCNSSKPSKQENAAVKDGSQTEENLSVLSDEPKEFVSPHGFGITAPGNFIADENLAEIVLRLEREDAIVEVFMEELPNEAETTVYSSYSNRFLDRGDLHSLDEQSETEINGRRALITRWHREKSGDGDRNYYCVTDIKYGATVYTVVIKANCELSELSFDYSAIAESLRIDLPVNEYESVHFENTHRASMNKETSALYEEYFGNNGNFHWGLYYHRQPVDGMDKFEALEE